MSTAIASTPASAAPRGDRLARAGRRLGFIVLALLVLAGLIGPYLIAHDPYSQDLLARLQEPVWAEGGDWNHILGTDQLGRDVLARALYGVRVSALIGLSVALMGVAANLLARVIERYRAIAYFGLVVILYVAGKMIYEGVIDPATGLMTLF